jgi:hypothetical protein
MMPAALVAALALLGPFAEAGNPSAPFRLETRPTGLWRPWEASAACATEVSGKLPIQLALRHYIKQTTPKPMRFLVAAGTDSALSETGAKVLQEFGPMYYYAGGEAAMQKVRERLDIVGPFPALLVVKRSSAKPTSSTEIIRLGGHFVTGEHDGKKAGSSQYTFVCGAGGWTMKDVKTEAAP